MANNPFEEIQNRFDALEKLILDIKRSKDNTQEEEKLLSPLEACKIFQPQISRVTLHNWTQQGLIQKHQVGGRVFYKKSEVLSALTSLKKYSRNPQQFPISNAK